MENTRILYLTKSLQVAWCWFRNHGLRGTPPRAQSRRHARQLLRGQTCTVNKWATDEKSN
ncbi:unnamed protein product, partial [Gulo gulo]